MNTLHRLSSSRWDRAGKVGIAIALAAAAGLVGGLTGLLLVMASLVPLGAAIADVKVLHGARDTWRSWHAFDGAQHGHPGE